MLKEVLFMGVRKASRLEPSQSTVIISILDQFEEHNWPSRLQEFKDHLMLNFVDTFEKPGETHWPDRMSEAEHRAACTWDEDRAPEFKDAQRIVEFVNRHHCVIEAVTLTASEVMVLLQDAGAQCARERGGARPLFPKGQQANLG